MVLEIPEKWSGTQAQIAIIIALTAFIFIISIASLSAGIQTVFTHLYYIPIILAAYWFERKGILLALFLSIFYVGAVYIFDYPDVGMVYIAIGRSVLFIGISAVAAILSGIIHRQHDRIAESESRFHGIWNSIQAGIILVDPKTHTIIAANPEAQKMTGFSEEEMTGHICHNYICPAEKGKCPISDLGMEVDHSERILLSRDGTGIPVLKTVTEVREGGGYYIESFIDITDLKDAETTLLAYLREATLRIRNPVELVRDNLGELNEVLEGQDKNPEYVKTSLAIQQKNMEDILENLREIERAVAEKRTEIPEALREYLRR